MSLRNLIYENVWKHSVYICRFVLKILTFMICYNLPKILQMTMIGTVIMPVRMSLPNRHDGSGLSSKLLGMLQQWQWCLELTTYLSNCTSSRPVWGAQWHTMSPFHNKKGETDVQGYRSCLSCKGNLVSFLSSQIMMSVTLIKLMNKFIKETVCDQPCDSVSF